MKKLFSLLLAAVLALGLTTMAWAVAEEEPGGQAGQTYTDDDRIVIEKCYRLVNDGAVSPAETFHFTLTTLGVTDSTETLDTMPRFTDADARRSPASTSALPRERPRRQAPSSPTR